MNRYKYSLPLLVLCMCSECARARPFKLLYGSTMVIERHVCMPFQPTRSCVHEAGIGFFFLRIRLSQAHFEWVAVDDTCCALDCTTLNIYIPLHSPSTHFFFYVGIVRSLLLSSLPHAHHSELNSFTPCQPEYGSLLSYSFPSLFWCVYILLCFRYIFRGSLTLCSYTRVCISNMLLAISHSLLDIFWLYTREKRIASMRYN